MLKLMIMLMILLMMLMMMMRLITKLLLEQALIGQAYQYCTVIIPQLFNINNARRRTIIISPGKSSKWLLQPCGYLEWLQIKNSSAVVMMTMTELSCDPILVGLLSDWHSWISCNSISTTIPPQTSAQYFSSVSSDFIQKKSKSQLHSLPYLVHRYA